MMKEWMLIHIFRLKWKFGDCITEKMSNFITETIGMYLHRTGLNILFLIFFAH